MAQRKKKGCQDESHDMHQYYMDIINCMPNVVYWIDIDCALKGCNHHFVNLLGLKRPKDFSSTPYEPMLKVARWSKERVEALRLDDMKVLFSGEPQYEVEEVICDSKGEKIYFLANRVPLVDKNKKVMGLVVVLTDITAHKKLEEQLEQLSPNEIKVSHITKPLPHEPHVLMVEDNFIAQKVEEALLTALHCHVDVAESGDKAVELFDPGKYDIVFMDIGLEDTSGYMVAKQLRQKEKDTAFHVPIIALTSYQADIVKYDCHDYFMDGVLTKPLSSEQAQQIIQHYIYHEDIPVNGLKSVE